MRSIEADQLQTSEFPEPHGRDEVSPSPKSSDWRNWKHHLHVVDPPAVAWATYRDTGRTEDGLATVVRDLFGNFLGPWSSDGLADYADHLGY